MSFYHPYPEQILFTSQGYTVEMCISEASLRETLRLRSFFYQQKECFDVPAEGDEFDHKVNTKVFVVHRGGEILGTIRNQVYSSEYQWSDSFVTKYSPRSLKALGPNIPSLFESNRFAIRGDLARREAFQIQGLLFRVQFLGNFIENVDQVITFVNRGHTNFYQKYMGMRLLHDQMTFKSYLFSVLGCPAPCNCSLSYSLPETLGIDQEECIARYRKLMQDHRRQMSITA